MTGLRDVKCLHCNGVKQVILVEWDKVSADITVSWTDIFPIRSFVFVGSCTIISNQSGRGGLITELHGNFDFERF